MSMARIERCNFAMREIRASALPSESQCMYGTPWVTPKQIAGKPREAGGFSQLQVMVCGREFCAPMETLAHSCPPSPPRRLQWPLYSGPAHWRGTAPWLRLCFGDLCHLLVALLREASFARYSASVTARSTPTLLWFLRQRFGAPPPGAWGGCFAYVATGSRRDWRLFYHYGNYCCRDATGHGASAVPLAF